MACMITICAICGIFSADCTHGEDISPDKAFSVNSGKYSVSSPASGAEILRGKTSFMVYVYGPPTPDSAGSDGYITLYVSGGSNLGILPGQQYVSFFGNTSDVRELTITKIPESGYVGIQFVTSQNTEPAVYKIKAEFPNGSSDSVKMKIVRYFGELDTVTQTEPIEVPLYRPRETASPTPESTPAEMQQTEMPTENPTEIPVQSPLGVCAAVAGICGALLILRRK